MMSGHATGRDLPSDGMRHRRAGHRRLRPGRGGAGLRAPLRGRPRAGRRPAAPLPSVPGDLLPHGRRPRDDDAARLSGRRHAADRAGHGNPDPAAAPDRAGGEASGRDRPAQRRPVAPRDRRRVERGGIRGAGPGLRRSRCALRRADRGDAGALDPGGCRLPRHLAPHSPCGTESAADPAADPGVVRSGQPRAAAPAGGGAAPGGATGRRLEPELRPRRRRPRPGGTRPCRSKGGCVSPGRSRAGGSPRPGSGKASAPPTSSPRRAVAA
jgi:hypothetical protein